MLTPIPLPRAPEAAASLLSDALASLAVDGAPVPREAAVAAFRRHLARIQSYVQHAFEHEQLTGLQAARLLGALVDGVVQALFEHTIANTDLNPTDQLSVAATGGYGRGVLAPFSDIDLLFLTEHDPSPETLRVVEYMLYFLWDLGLKVGHATRSIQDCLVEGAKDTTIRTALLDARFLTGDKALFADFHLRFRAACKEAGAAEYIAAKQAERAVRHRRYGDSPFVVEPNVKEGRGGLRDLQTLYWIARYVFDTQTMGELADLGGILTQQEARHGRRAWEFLWTVRFHLHYVAGRAEERLTFDLQPVVGARMGYTRHGRQDGVERFMRHYFLTAREIARLTRILEPAILRSALGPPALEAETDDALLAAGFVLAEGKLMPRSGRDFDSEPIQMLRVLQVARDRGLELHPLTLRSFIQNERRVVQLRGDKQAADIFMDLLCGKEPDRRAGSTSPDGAKWLNIMNETGFLGRYLPDWARIVGQMQFDTYHIFTVDEHTIEAVRVLNTLERGELGTIAPVASELIEHVQSRRSLYLAMLLHDIAKGRGGDHSEIGAEIALEVGPALGLSDEETETVSWLVLHHLLLSATAFKRDIDDPKTILDLAETIQSPERLRLLLILTVADMRAVSSKVWNGWKATLLRELYARVAEVLEGGLATPERDVRAARAKQAVAALLTDWTPEEVEHFTSLGYAGYWLSFDPETHARHARLILDSERRKSPLTVDTQPLPARAVTEVTVYTADHSGLFSQISGALAVAGASIVDARIHTMTNGMALDTFWIQDAAGGTFDAPHKLARLSVLIEQTLSGRLRLDREIQRVSKILVGRRMQAIHVPPRVVIDNHASNTHTVVEVNGRDRPGLLHDLTAAISEQGLQIGSAHVTTYGVRAVDVFYVKDVFGMKVENERKLRQLRDALLHALTSGDEAVAPPVPTPRKIKRAAAG
ncbi:MAG TPA: [protein-PII] uridylyltransferase [Rhodopila sp.]|uniref:[protein-PII] uridylyltransferase n=1 Tax=Rhodopila sp. TaxID=2480087 RepID=UPI002C28250E|nr:[protein-PII] uridylyltransferase [Rhodopila sp.]HVY16104.1 [protein-PII] uridylyltransferase [Rhodopila sp.]